MKDVAEMDFKEILTNIARALVDEPDAVNVVEEVDGDDIELTLTVAENDTGMVIGRHGRIAKAIRQIMNRRWRTSYYYQKRLSRSCYNCSCSCSSSCACCLSNNS